MKLGISKAEDLKNKSTSFCKKWGEPFRSYASCIDDISTIRFVHYHWNREEGKYEKPSKLQEVLYYAQVVNQFCFLSASLTAYCHYLITEENTNLGALVSDALILIGLSYGMTYQLNELKYGRDVMFHVNQQRKLNDYFSDLLGIQKSEWWNHGLCYFLCVMCNFSRPMTPIGFFPYFLKKNSAMNVYFALGGKPGEVGYFIYSFYSAFVMSCTYTITNYYAVLVLGHTYFYSYWFHIVCKRMSEDKTEAMALITQKMYRALTMQNKNYHPAYSRLILPPVIFFASAWVVFTAVCLIKLADELGIVIILMVGTAASQAIIFLSVKFYSSHRMTCDSEDFLHSRKAFHGLIDRKYNKSFHCLRVWVSSNYFIEIDNMNKWGEALVNYIILLLSVF